MYSLNVISIFELPGNLFSPIIFQAKYEYYIQNSHTNKTGQRPNNRRTHSVKPSVKQSRGKGEQHKLSTDTLNNMDTDKSQCKNQAEDVGNENICAGDKTNM